MPRPFWCAICIAAAFLGTISANWNDTSTGIDLNKLQPFPLNKIRSGWLKDGERTAFDGIAATAASGEGDVRLKGAGVSGKRWEVHLSSLDEVWRGDLDGNGTQDYVLFAVGPYGNGRTAPSFSLSILLMDRDRMPVPFFTVVYRGENGDGIKHLVDLNHDGHAELLISTYDERVYDPRVEAFCSGHWTNQLYRFRNLSAEEIRGRMGGMSFPFVHDWTYRGTVCPDMEKPYLSVEPAILREHGTSMQGEIVTTIRQVDHSIGLLTIDPVAGCKTIRADVVVYDRPNLRSIAFPNLSSDYSASLATRIQRRGMHVQLRGINNAGDGDCLANLMSAR